MTEPLLRLVAAGVKAPPYPTDTRSKGWHFALDVPRMKQSDTWKLAVQAGVENHLLRLWVESWEQIPCGSLPDDDAVLAATIAYPLGMFTTHRDVLMRRWWKATDGRYYHPEVTKLVLGRLDWKEAERTRKQKYREEQERKIMELQQRPTGQTRDATVRDGTVAVAVAGELPLGSVSMNTVRSAAPKQPRSQRMATNGRRLSKDEPLPDEWRNWAIACYPKLKPPQVVRMWVEFRNYWSDVPGQRGLKLEWRQTWENNVHKKMTDAR